MLVYRGINLVFKYYKKNYFFNVLKEMQAIKHDLNGLSMEKSLFFTLQLKSTSMNF